MQFTASLKEITYDNKGNKFITFITKNNIDEIDSESELTINVAKKRNKRSLDANAYCWVLINKLANVLNQTPTNIYRSFIRDVPGAMQVVPIRTDVVNVFIREWTSKGIGYQVETSESKLTGYTNCLIYFGSSSFDSGMMAKMIELIIDECKEQNIETLTPNEITKLKLDWRKDNE